MEPSYISNRAKTGIVSRSQVPNNHTGFRNIYAISTFVLNENDSASA